MESVEEVPTGGRVTRSQRRRIESIDSDNTSRCGTPVFSKLVMNTPSKSLITRAQTPELNSPLRRVTRRSSVNIEEGEFVKNLNNSVSANRTLNLESPARRNTRRRSMSICEDENYTPTKLIKPPKIETVEEDEEKEEKGSATQIENGNKSPSPLKNTITYAKETIRSSKKLPKFRSEIQVINFLDDGQMEDMNGNAGKSENNNSTETNANRSVKALANELPEKKDASLNASISNRGIRTTPNRRKSTTTVIDIERSPKSKSCESMESLTCGAEPMSPAEKARSVQFEDTGVWNSLKNKYPTTPGLTKSKSCLDADISQYSAEMEKSYSGTPSAKSSIYKGIEANATDDSRDLEAMLQENDQDFIGIEKTPHGSKKLKSIQSSTPIVEPAKSVKGTLANDTMDSPDKLLRSGKMYGSSPTSLKEISQNLNSPKRNQDSPIDKVRSNDTSLKQASFANSWSPGVSVTGTNNLQKIDTIAAASPAQNREKECIIVSKSPKPIAMQETTVVDKDDESSLQAETSNRCPFVLDEDEDAGNDYDSGDSLGGEARREIMENEIVEKGESIGSQDTDEESESDEEQSDSFIAPDDEVDLLSYSDDDENLSAFPRRKRPNYKRLQMPSDDSNDGVADTDEITPNAYAEKKNDAGDQNLNQTSESPMILQMSVDGEDSDKDEQDSKESSVLNATFTPEPAIEECSKDASTEATDPQFSDEPGDESLVNKMETSPIRESNVIRESEDDWLTLSVSQLLGERERNQNRNIAEKDAECDDVNGSKGSVSRRSSKHLNGSRRKSLTNAENAKESPVVQTIESEEQSDNRSTIEKSPTAAALNKSVDPVGAEADEQLCSQASSISKPDFLHECSGSEEGAERADGVDKIQAPVDIPLKKSLSHFSPKQRSDPTVRHSISGGESAQQNHTVEKRAHKSFTGRITVPREDELSSDDDAGEGEHTVPTISAKQRSDPTVRHSISGGESAQQNHTVEKRAHKSFTGRITVPREDELSSDNDAGEDEYTVSTISGPCVSSDDDQRLQKVMQVQKLNEICVDDKAPRRKTMGGSKELATTPKKKKKLRASLPYGGDLQPSQSFVENIVARKRDLQEKNDRRPNRLSKSLNSADEAPAEEARSGRAILVVADVHASETGEKRITAMHSSTPYTKSAANDGNNNTESILAYCEQILQAQANRVKVESDSRNTKKKNNIAKKLRKQAAQAKKNTKNKSSAEPTNQSIADTEKTKQAVDKAVKASFDILLSVVEGKKTRKRSAVTEEDEKLNAKRLPWDMLEAIAQNSAAEYSNPKKKKRLDSPEMQSPDQENSKGARIAHHKRHILQTAAGNVSEAPLTPAEKKKFQKIKLSTGVVSVEPLTPKKKNNGFRESPITPNNGFKVRRIMTAGQDVPPEMPVVSQKDRKRSKRKIEEPRLVLPPPQWTQSGYFVEEALPSTRVVQHREGATQFAISALGGGNKGKWTKPTSACLNANALNFKLTSKNNSNALRESSRAVLQRKERSHKKLF